MKRDNYTTKRKSLQTGMAGCGSINKSGTQDLTVISANREARELNNLRQSQS
jgi:hypothetical protein